MGLKEKKGRRTEEMYRGKGSDFEVKEGEGILRLTNGNQVKAEKNYNLRQKKKWQE